MSEGSRAYFEASNFPRSANNRYVPNRKVACEPLASMSVETQGKTFVVAKQKVALQRLKVIWGNERYLPGSFVYVRGDIKNTPWVGEVFELGGSEAKDGQPAVAGTKFILVPEDYIQMVDVEVPGDKF